MGLSMSTMASAECSNRDGENGEKHTKDSKK